MTAPRSTAFPLRRSAPMPLTTPWLVCEALYALARSGPWRGTSSALWVRLHKMVPKRYQRLEGWPKSAEITAMRARQAVARLRKEGVKVTFSRVPGRPEPLIQVSKVEPQPAAATPRASDDQRPLFTTEEIEECARAAGGKRWR